MKANRHVIVAGVVAAALVTPAGALAVSIHPAATHVVAHTAKKHRSKHSTTSVSTHSS
jgi:hypothetical protein